jgi:hypothetical protein
LLYVSIFKRICRSDRGCANTIWRRSNEIESNCGLVELFCQARLMEFWFGKPGLGMLDLEPCDPKWSPDLNELPPNCLMFIVQSVARNSNGLPLQLHCFKPTIQMFEVRSGMKILLPGTADDLCVHMFAICMYVLLLCTVVTTWLTSGLPASDVDW